MKAIISEEPTEQTGQRRSGRRAGMTRIPTRRTPYLANDYRQSRVAVETRYRSGSEPFLSRGETLDTEIKTRIPKADKRQLQKLADERHLKISDIIREAVREKIESPKEPASK